MNRDEASPLKRRIIIACLTVLLFAWGATICISGLIGYAQLAQSADTIIAEIVNNNGTLPASGTSLSAESPYESRWFTAYVTPEETHFDLDHIASVNEEQAQALVNKVMKPAAAKNDFVGNYRYLVNDSENGSMIVFLDRGRQLIQYQSQMVWTAGTEGLLLLGVLLLIVVFAGTMVKPITESYTKQKQFIADAGHDIKTPISVILADAELLSYEVGEDNEWLQDIVKQSNKMNGLVNDLMFLTKMEGDKEEVKLIAVDFTKIVNEECSSYRAVAQSDNKEFNTDISEGIKVIGEQKGLVRMVSILCDNAMKYSTDNGNVNVTLRKKGHNAILSVSNDVDSLDTSGMSKWFDRFYREDNARNHSKGAGYGIGLSLAAAVVSQSGGTITARATRNKKRVIIDVVLPTANKK